jgi:hypothetical protein
VSKKYTWRIWASIGSTASASPARLRSASGTVSLSSTLSAWRIFERSSVSASSEAEIVVAMVILSVS